MRTTPRTPASTPRWIGPRTVQQLINGISMDLDALGPNPSDEDLGSIIARLQAVQKRVREGNACS